VGGRLAGRGPVAQQQNALGGQDARHGQAQG
jgi:hypothetical protein